MAEVSQTQDFQGFQGFVNSDLKDALQSSLCYSLCMCLHCPPKQRINL